ncbi:RagB/SusD family nutrient uptake outer membrane protein [Sediminibacterium sp. TEGAF015]|uniref:RagB/SusD family nutrient uptake outer membrane protein n=1 Tax=Sediminibacterium sp. TEGAF015 TaxID=575378 RepID=UPI0021FAC32A|nr:RagB/SusD family nutrient uptake outer membrane protein [Sediminibacterium sp. TEGAF015]BDQ12384.1 membrane protein [Sediminibacterium sp. TEGAF015]
MKKNKLVILAFVAASLGACQKVIDVKETDFIGGDIALKTVANNESGIIGAYSAMNVEMGILLNATFADEVKPGEFYNAGTTHEWQYGSQDVGLRDNFTAFNLYYRIIDRVNRVLVALPNAVPANATEAALKDRLRGEALFLRAFCHFELYKYYSNSAVGTDLAMAYMETPSLASLPRIQVAPYFAKLKADMVAAKPLLPTALTDIYRATRPSVSALQARVALYLKEYTDAVTFSTEYINAIPLASRANFPGIWTDANNSELAFKLSRTPSLGGRIGSLFQGTSANSGAISQTAWVPSSKLWNAYDQTNDIRFSSYFRTEPLLAAAGRPSQLVAKYRGTTYGTPGEHVADAKVFRTGEMYLIRAEANAELNNLVGATNDLNTLRAARINGYTNVTLATKDAAITEIMQERFLELPYEGHRFFDLKRRNLPVSRLLADAPNANAQTLPAGNFRFLLPIPNPEINANPLIQQNPGYTN